MMRQKSERNGLLLRCVPGLSLLLVIVLLAACGGDSSSSRGAVQEPSGPGDTGGAPGDGDDGGGDSGEEDDELRRLALEAGLTGDPAGELTQVTPAEDPLVNLGKVLFFSRTLSGGMDVACASCHHPDLAGGDGLSLPVGVAAANPEVIGLGRVLDASLDLSPDADGGPNVPRNSQSIFNVGLYDRALFHDGRVFVLDDERESGGRGQRIATPESGTVADVHGGKDLLEAQAGLPLVSHEEMRDFIYPGLSTPDAYREHIVERLRGNADAAHIPRSDGPANWQSLFEAVYSAPDQSEGEMITFARIREALAAYQRSMIFVDSPWVRFMQGEDDALSNAARRGGKLFFKPHEEGGLGCVQCHGGDRFTNEEFYNVAFPQIGRGRRTDGSDQGRFDVNMNTKTVENRFAFRVPSLLNVGIRDPYGHAGTFPSLELLLPYHANPRTALSVFDFSLSLLPQAQLSGADGLTLYPRSLAFTTEAMEAESFAVAEEKLPGRFLSPLEIMDLSAFLDSLTDECAADSGCTAPWVADPLTDDPDGNLLIRGEPFTRATIDGAHAYPSGIDLHFPAVGPRATFADMENCTPGNSALNQNREGFLHRSSELGLDISHGFDVETWMGSGFSRGERLMPTMMAGGIAASYVSGDCWADILLAGGDSAGTVILKNRGGQEGFEASDLFENQPPSRVASIAVADITGNFRREVLLGNLHSGAVPVYTQRDDGRYVQAGALPMDRTTYGMAFGHFNDSGFPDLYTAHWGPGGTPGHSPVFWINEGDGELRVGDEEAGLSWAEIEQGFQFAPGFADFTGDGRQDLVVAADFGGSIVMQNAGSGAYLDRTDRSVITDEFGMGAAIGDFNNNGKLDWFVTSISAVPEAADDEFCTNWSGNRLYRNISTGDELRFEDITRDAGVHDGGWGWAACAADFNNNGYLDIFHVNGMNEFPDSLRDAVGDQLDFDQNVCKGFTNQRPVLFINNGDGSFTDRSLDWDLDFPVDGRGLTCFDYDRDGDMDIAILDHSGEVVFLENQVGSGPGSRFLSLRLMSAPPNTEALGARVHVTADIHDTGIPETQLREVMANSNFASQNPPDLHFGLGQAAEVEQLRVRWPDGQELICSDLPVNEFLIIDQRQGQAACP